MPTDGTDVKVSQEFIFSRAKKLSPFLCIFTLVESLIYLDFLKRNLFFCSSQNFLRRNVCENSGCSVFGFISLAEAFTAFGHAIS